MDNNWLAWYWCWCWSSALIFLFLGIPPNPLISIKTIDLAIQFDIVFCTDGMWNIYMEKQFSRLYLCKAIYIAQYLAFNSLIRISRHTFCHHLTMTWVYKMYINNAYCVANFKYEGKKEKEKERRNDEKRVKYWPLFLFVFVFCCCRFCCLPDLSFHFSLVQRVDRIFYAYIWENESNRPSDGRMKKKHATEYCYFR